MKHILKSILSGVLLLFSGCGKAPQESAVYPRYQLIGFHGSLIAFDTKSADTRVLYLAKTNIQWMALPNPFAKSHQVDGVGVVEFPIDMTDEEVQTALKSIKAK